MLLKDAIIKREDYVRRTIYTGIIDFQEPPPGVLLLLISFVKTTILTSTTLLHWLLPIAVMMMLWIQYEAPYLALPVAIRFPFHNSCNHE